MDIVSGARIKRKAQTPKVCRHLKRTTNFSASGQLGICVRFWNSVPLQNSLNIAWLLLITIVAQSTFPASAQDLSANDEAIRPYFYREIDVSRRADAFHLWMDSRVDRAHFDRIVQPLIEGPSTQDNRLPSELLGYYRRTRVIFLSVKLPQGQIATVGEDCQLGTAPLPPYPERDFHRGVGKHLNYINTALRELRAELKFDCSSRASESNFALHINLQEVLDQEGSFPTLKSTADSAAKSYNDEAGSVWILPWTIVHLRMHPLRGSAVIEYPLSAHAQQSLVMLLQADKVLASRLGVMPDNLPEMRRRFMFPSSLGSERKLYATSPLLADFTKLSLLDIVRASSWDDLRMDPGAESHPAVLKYMMIRSLGLAFGFRSGAERLVAEQNKRLASSDIEQRLLIASVGTRYDVFTEQCRDRMMLDIIRLFSGAGGVVREVEFGALYETIRKVSDADELAELYRQENEVTSRNVRFSLGGRLMDIEGAVAAEMQSPEPLIGQFKKLYRN